MLASQAIATGDIDIAVAGGMESMSNCPYLLAKVREGLRMGDAKVIDSMIHDGLWDAFHDMHMGLTGEHVSETYKVSREDQDRFAADSHRKAAHVPLARAGSRTRFCRSRFRRRRATRSSSTRTSRSAGTRRSRRSRS